LYRICRVCERFSATPDAFARLSHQEQLRWLAYEDVREAEEAGHVEE